MTLALLLTTKGVLLPTWARAPGHCLPSCLVSPGLSPPWPPWHKTRVWIDPVFHVLTLYYMQLGLSSLAASLPWTSKYTLSLFHRWWTFWSTSVIYICKPDSSYLAIRCYILMVLTFNNQNHLWSIYQEDLQRQGDTWYYQNKTKQSKHLLGFNISGSLSSIIVISGGNLSFYSGFHFSHL